MELGILRADGPVRRLVDTDWHLLLPSKAKRLGRAVTNVRFLCGRIDGAAGGDHQRTFAPSHLLFCCRRHHCRAQRQRQRTFTSHCSSHLSIYQSLNQPLNLKNLAGAC